MKLRGLSLNLRVVAFVCLFVLVFLPLLLLSLKCILLLFKQHAETRRREGSVHVELIMLGLRKINNHLVFSSLKYISLTLHKY